MFFVLIRVVDSLIPQASISETLRTGFAHGALTPDPYPRDALQGRDRYSDCISAQIAVVGGAGVLRNALAPGLLAKEQVDADLSVGERNPCLELQQYLNGSLRPAEGVTYARFWHGASSMLKAALLVLPFDGYRAFLLNTTLALIAGVAVCAALADRRLLLALAPLLALSFAVDGQVGYGQLVSYGPSALAMWAIALLMVIRREFATGSGLFVLAAVAGALEAFFDQMISVPLAAAVFLIVASTTSNPMPNGAHRGVAAIAGAAATWWIGLASTYAVKLILSTAMLGPNAFADFRHQLLYRAGTVDPTFGLEVAANASRMAVVVRAVLRLSLHNWLITYGDGPSFGCLILVVIGLAGWITAAVQGRRRVRNGDALAYLQAGSGYLAACMTVALWILVFPEHALRHTFTVRATAIWLVGGWGWVCSARAYLGAPVRRSIAPASSSFEPGGTCLTQPPLSLEAIEIRC